MLANGFNSSAERGLQVWLDGRLVSLPSDRRSLTAIRSYLDMLALERQRILYYLSVDGERASFAELPQRQTPFARVEGETLDLDQMPLQLIRMALEQTRQARDRVHSSVVLVLINEGCVAREFWWKLAAELKEPLLTLSLLPETLCGPNPGYASLIQLRKWQLQQLGGVLKSVDEACWSEDPQVLSNALENQALTWLDNLLDQLKLWHETLRAGACAAGQPV